MPVRVLSDEEYAHLAHKVLTDAGLPETTQHAVNQIRQAHRLLCDGHSPEELTPAEQMYASAFKGALLAQIPNDYGWEPGIESEAVSEPASETVKTAPPPKPKKNEK